MGLNTVDALAAMDPSYALSAQNVVANPQGIALRNGYRKWATGLGAPVTSLIPYQSGSNAASRLFAVAGANVFDVTTGGAVGAAAVTGLNPSYPYWQYANQTFGTGGGHYLMMVNGIDAPRMYDGTTWTTTTQVTTPSAPGQFKTTDNNGNAVSTASFVDVQLHQQRLWFVQANSTRAYYTDIATAGGNLFLFDFGPFFPNGGHLLKLASWTIDISGTSGTQTLLVAISDKGDVVTYAGNNPAVAGSFSLIGTYKIGSPVGRRCTRQLAGDLLILCQDGLIGMSKYMQSATLNSASLVSYTISPTITNLVATNPNTPGFDIAVYPSMNALMLNVPQATQAANFQFCLNTQTGGWTQFTGWPAQCWGLFNDTLYFGGTDFVALAFIGYEDAADTNGANGNNIIGTVLQAFNPMAETHGLGRKHVKLVKPYLVSGDSNPAIRVGVNVDYNLVPIVGSATVNPITGAVWDNAVFDNPGSTWVGSLATYNQWVTPLCYPGETFALAISFSGTTDTLWTGTAWIIEPGGLF
jgi:hypothetical protein